MHSTPSTGAAKINAPGYLAKLIESYLSGRALWYGTDDGTNEYIIIALVPQGSVLGPLYWNVMYNGVLLLPVAEEATLFGFADDVAIVIVTKLPEDVEVYTTKSVVLVRSWHEGAGLSLAEEKTEGTLIKNRRKKNTISLQVESYMIVSNPTIKYLGVTVDAKLSFKGHILYACEKATKITTALASMMANVCWRKQCSRLLIAGVVFMGRGFG